MLVFLATVTMQALRESGELDDSNKYHNYVSVFDLQFIFVILSSIYGGNFALHI